MRTGVISAAVLSTKGGIDSVPVALSVFGSFNSLFTPWVDVHVLHRPKRANSFVWQAGEIFVRLLLFVRASVLVSPAGSETMSALCVLHV